VRVYLPVLALLAIASPAAAAGDADDLVGLALFPGQDTGVVWSARSIQSLDGARVFLPGAANVAAVTTTADGAVVAIRGRNQLGVAAPNAAPVWRTTPLAGKTIGLVYVGNQIAWFVETRRRVALALTADQGRHWTVQSLPDVDEGHLELGAGGVLELDGYIYDCHGGDYSVRYRGRIGSGRWRLTRTAAETAFRWPSHYKPAERDRDGPLTGADETVRSDGSIDEGAPDGFSLIAADAHGRLLAVTKSNVWRWSKATGWQPLRAAQDRP
jgi:hypothetical protein